MRLVCPACRKSHDLDGFESVCSRCGCELETLALVRQAADWHLRAATRSLKQGRWRVAWDHAQQSWTHRHSREAACVVCLAAAALGETASLQRWRARATHPSFAGEPGPA